MTQKFIPSKKKFVLGLFVGLCAAFTADAAKPSAEFEKTLQAIHKSGTKVSAQIVNLTNTRVLLDVNGDLPLNPASSSKLFTGYFALKRLGTNFQYKTEFYKTSDRSLCVKGSGDPSFVMEDLYLVVEAMKRKGLESYSGKITLDASAFDSEYYPEDRSDQNSERAYNSPIAGLNFNYNTITVFVNPTEKGQKAKASLDFPFDFVKINNKVTTGSSTDVTWSKTSDEAPKDEVVSLGGKIGENADEWKKPFRLRDPARGFGFALSKMLSTLGVHASGKVDVTTGTCLGQVIYTHSSKPMSYIVELMNKYSNNFIADSLVKTLDREVNRRSGTAAGGMKFMRDEMSKIGIDVESKGRKFVAGSGLTRDNMMASSDFIKLLKVIDREKLVMPEVYASLPIAGIDGTLRRKYVRSAVEERLRGKTGSLSGVQSLVGIYPNKEGEWLAIAITTNGSKGIPEAELAKFLNQQ